MPAGVEPARAGALVRVREPLRALGHVGAMTRRRLHDATVVGITGSTGKTGTKDLTAAVLGRKFLVHASPGSYNNEAGVPITLASAPAATEALVLEMGARAAGDIAALCELARPTVGVVTNVGLAHAGRLGGLEGVRRVKGELVEALEPSGLAVLDAGDPSTALLAARTRARVLRVSVGAGGGDAHVVAADVSIDAELRPSFTLSSPWGSAHARLALRGEHHVVNATLAALRSH